jgi:arginyl-tRNA synthetase
MIQIENLLTEKIAIALNTLFALNISPQTLGLQATKKEFEGDLTFVVFPYTKISKKSPEETATLIGDFLAKENTIVERYTIVKGYLNFVIKPQIWIQLLAEISQTKNFGQQAANGKKVMVEYSSPNTNKPLHLGHLRNNFLGFSVSNILEMNGYEVLKANLVNDRGIHICKSMLAYQKFGNGETPQSAEIKGDKLVGNYYVRFEQENKKLAAILYQEFETQGLIIDEKTEATYKEKVKLGTTLMKEAQMMLKKWEDGDETVVNLWKMMNGWVYQGFEETYQQIGVKFDKFYYESNTYLLGKDVVEEGLEKKIFYRKEDNSVWIDLTNDGLDHKLVLRGDGTSVYITQDMGTADLKYADFPMQKSIYVIGNEQDYHMKVLKLIMQKLQRPYADGMFHLSYGMVELPNGKMKSREGTVVDADDLVQELIDLAKEKTQELGKIQELSVTEQNKLFHTLGLGAIKYFLLKVDPKKTMVFNPEESLQLNGDTATYIQYTYARTATVLREATLQKIDYSYTVWQNSTQLHEIEQAIIQHFNQYTTVLHHACEDLSPALLGTYCYDLAKLYGRFFHDLSIFKAENEVLRAFRLALSAEVGKVLKSAMGLLGIEMPERM